MRKIFLFCGAVFGFWSISSPGTLAVVLLAAAMCYFICINAHDKLEAKFLAGLFVLSVTLFFVLCAAHFYAAIILKNDSDLIGDASAYSCHGAYIAHVLSGGAMNVNTNYIDIEELNLTNDNYRGALPDYREYRIGFFGYFYGMIYYFFGFSPLVVKILNSLLGAMACFLIYFWMRDTFGYTQARISLMLTLFYPPRIIWAASGLKDTLVFVGFALFLFIFYKLRRSSGLFWYLLFFCTVMFVRNIGWIFVLVLTAMAIFNRRKYVILTAEFLALKIADALIFWVRPYFIGPIIAVFAVSMCSALSKNWLKRLSFLMIMILSVCAVMGDRIGMRERINTHIREVIQTHRTQAEAGEYAVSRYRVYPERFYDRSVPVQAISAITAKEFLISVLIGVSYFFLSPFPWSLKSTGLAIGYVISAGLYVLLPFILIGIMMGLRYHWREALSFVLMVLIVSAFLPLVLGNAGTLFRHRDVIMPFFIAFAAIGIIQVTGRGNRKVSYK